MIPFLLAASLCLLQPAAPVLPEGGTVVVKGKRFLAELAQNPKEQARGLAYRTNLAKDRCMFFLFQEEGAHPMRTKNCLIPLDAVWVDAEGAVVELKESLPPCKPGTAADACPEHGGAVPARHVVAFPAGTIRRLGVKVGQRIGWQLQLADGSPFKGGAAVPAEEGGRRKGARKGRKRR